MFASIWDHEKFMCKETKEKQWTEFIEKNNKIHFLEWFETLRCELFIH